MQTINLSLNSIKFWKRSFLHSWTQKKFGFFASAVFDSEAINTFSDYAKWSKPAKSHQINNKNSLKTSGEIPRSTSLGIKIRCNITFVWISSLCTEIHTLWKLNEPLLSYIFVQKVCKMHVQSLCDIRTETNISRKGIARTQSQFPHSCVCERSIYFHDRAAYSVAGNMWTDKSLTATWMWKLVLRPRNSQKRNT